MQKLLKYHSIAFYLCMLVLNAYYLTISGSLSFLWIDGLIGWLSIHWLPLLIFRPVRLSLEEQFTSQKIFFALMSYVVFIDLWNLSALVGALDGQSFNSNLVAVANILLLVHIKMHTTYLPTSQKIEKSTA